MLAGTKHEGALEQGSGGRDVPFGGGKRAVSTCANREMEFGGGDQSTCKTS